MPLVKTPAIILKSQRWGEADRIVTFHTVRLGKVRGFARGARRMKSRFGSALEPFAYVDLTLFEKGNDSLSRVSQVDIRESFSKLREDLERMSAAARMVNLIEGVSADRDPSPRVFTTLLEGLRALQGGADPSTTTLVFQIHVLGHTGFRPQIDFCVSCGKSIELPVAGFYPLAGGLICQLCGRAGGDQWLPMSAGSIAFTQQARRMQFPLATRLKADGQIKREVEDAIEAYVKVVVGRQLPVPDFLVADRPSPPYGALKSV